MNGTSIKFDNTCVFDSLTEIFLESYFYNDTIGNFVDKGREYCKYLKLIHNFCNDDAFNLPDLYEERAKLLYPLGKKTSFNHIDCKVDVTELVVQLLTDNANF